MKGIQVRKTKNGSISYQAQIRITGCKPIYKTFKRKTDAEKWLRQTKTDIERGLYFPQSQAKKHTVSDLIVRYLEESLPTRKSKQNPIQTLNWWKDKIGYLTLDKLTTSVIKEHWDSLGKKPSARTGKPLTNRSLNSYLETFSACLNKASMEYDWIKDNPISKIKKKSVNNQRTRFLNEKERAEFMKAVKNSQNSYLKLAVLISLSTGGRRSEVLGLKWSDVDLSKGRITFRDTKNGETRSIALWGSALEQIKAQSRKSRFTTEYVFQAKRSKTSKTHQVPWEDPRASFNVALKEAGITNFRWHDMRHCFASYLIASGATLAEVGKMLGHKSPQMTWRYSHLLQDKSDELIKKVSQKI